MRVRTSTGKAEIGVSPWRATDWVSIRVSYERCSWVQCPKAVNHRCDLTFGRVPDGMDVRTRRHVALINIGQAIGPVPRYPRQTSAATHAVENGDGRFGPWSVFIFGVLRTPDGTHGVSKFRVEGLLARRSSFQFPSPSSPEYHQFVDRFATYVQVQVLCLENVELGRREKMGCFSE
jgi:hypothetical protein